MHDITNRQLSVVDVTLHVMVTGDSVTLYIMVTGDGVSVYVMVTGDGVSVYDIPVIPCNIIWDFIVISHNFNLKNTH